MEREKLKMANKLSRDIFGVKIGIETLKREKEYMLNHTEDGKIQIYYYGAKYRFTNSYFEDIDDTYITDRSKYVIQDPYYRDSNSKRQNIEICTITKDEYKTLMDIKINKKVKELQELENQFSSL